MDYLVVYDLAEARHSMWNFAEFIGPVAVLAVGVGIVVIVMPQFAGQLGASRWRVLIGLMLIVIPTAVFTIGMIEIHSKHESLMSAIAESRYSEVEGFVSELTLDETIGPGINGGSFVVDSVLFNYKPSISSIGLRYQKRQRDVIQDGQRVRIRYVDETIVRLEVSG